MISTDGTPTRSRPLTNRAYVTVSVRSSARNAARASSAVTLANSAGCSFSGPRSKLSRGAAADRADQDDQHQQHDRDAVEEPGPLAPPVVVERHHHDHRDHRADQEDLLAGDVQVRVGELGVRRRVDDEQPDDRQRRLSSSSTQSMLRLGEPGLALMLPRPESGLRESMLSAMDQSRASTAAGRHELSASCGRRCRHERVEVERIAGQHREPSASRRRAR